LEGGEGEGGRGKKPLGLRPKRKKGKRLSIEMNFPVRWGKGEKKEVKKENFPNRKEKKGKERENFSLPY